MPELHPQLAKDCLEIARLPLSRVLLMNDEQYPWIILVPDRDDITEIHQLSERDQQHLMRESSAISRALKEQFDADKINIGMLGNIVPQLHVHHIARFRNDAAWPGPVWGRHPAIEYSADELSALLERLESARIPGIHWLGQPV